MFFRFFFADVMCGSQFGCYRGFHGDMEDEADEEGGGGGGGEEGRGEGG